MCLNFSETYKTQVLIFLRLYIETPIYMKYMQINKYAYIYIQLLYLWLFVISTTREDLLVVEKMK